MPYKSDAQRKFFHSEGAQKAGISDEQVKEFDQASKGMKLSKKAKSQHDGKSLLEHIGAHQAVKDAKRQKKKQLKTNPDPEAEYNDHDEDDQE